MSLTGKTVLITGASRGIGRAIALKMAKEKANVVILAKTTQQLQQQHMAGTIYSVADEIKKLGAKALPMACDIRYEDQIRKAVDAAISEFGGIDIVVNNASALSLTGTLDTPLKKWDLMMGINARGTFAVTQACLPYLMKSKNNPHVLNISPPLLMHSKWFKDNTAYTIAKYGMSMCVLGQSEEFKQYGIAVNALWPKTAIRTAAVEMLANHDKDYIKNCRNADIMADAAATIFKKDSRSFTGNFCIDEQVLRDAGYTTSDLDKYAPGIPQNQLLLDFFLPDEYANDGNPMLSKL